MASAFGSTPLLSDASDLVTSVTVSMASLMATNGSTMAVDGSTTTHPTTMKFVEPASAEYVRMLASNMDQFFIVISAVIIFYIQAGFAFLEAGCVRSKNATNIFMKNLLDLLIAGMAYWLFGHALAFGKGNGFFGYTKWPILGLEDTEYAHWLYQFVYASTSASIVNGAVAERCTVAMHLAYTTVISGLIYPTCVHMAWSDDGWLKPTAFHDFSGTGVVHMVGGAACVVSCFIMGPRTDIFHPVTGRKRTIRGHSTPLAALGIFTLFFGVMAFNGSTVGHISQPGDGPKVSLAMCNTVLSAAGSGLAAFAFRRLGWFVDEGREEKAWSFMITVNGTFVGMVASCAGCDDYPTWAAVVCGIVSSAIFLNIRRVTQRSKYFDDPLDAIAVHFGGGWWGMISAALLTKNGFFLSGNREILLWNVAGCLSMMAWTWLVVGLLFGVYRYFGIHRVTPEEEIQGLDIVKHKEPAYPSDDWCEDFDDYDGDHHHGSKRKTPRKSSTSATIVFPSSNDVGGLVMRDRSESLAGGGGGDGDFNIMMREMCKKTNYSGHPRVVNAIFEDRRETPSAPASSQAETASPDLSLGSVPRMDFTDESKPFTPVADVKKTYFPSKSFSMTRAVAKRLKNQQHTKDGDQLVDKPDGDPEQVYKTVRF